MTNDDDVRRQARTGRKKRKGEETKAKKKTRSPAEGFVSHFPGPEVEEIHVQLMDA